MWITFLNFVEVGFYAVARRGTRHLVKRRLVHSIARDLFFNYTMPESILPHC